jgi:putative ABC transport system permease protein
MNTTFQDLRYAVRMLVRSRGFTLVAILTLALGIGANTAIFTVVNAIVLKPLPYRDAEGLVMVWQDLRARGGPEDEWLTPGNYADLRSAKDVVGEIAVISGWRPALSGLGDPESIQGEQVSHEYFSVLGVSPALGATFTQQDDVPNAPRVVIVSDAFWRTRFGGDPSAIGRMITLSGEPHRVIGVMPRGFRPLLAGLSELWRPARLNTADPSRGAIVLRSIARLPAGVTLERAQAAATALSRQLEAAYPQYNEKMVFNVMPLKDRVIGNVRPALLALVGAVGFVLLIACANIANLLLARGSARGRELAVRVALGARRGRIVRQLLTESVLLAAVGGIAGILLGVWGTEGLLALAPQSMPRLDEVRLEPRVFAFASLVTLLTGVIFGLGPALQAARGVSHSLKEGSRGSTGASGRGLRRLLIAAEVGLALILLTGGGLLLRGFVDLQRMDLGFAPANALVGFVFPPRTSYSTPAARLAFYDQILERASALPGVQQAALSSIIPLSGGDNDTSFAIEGRPEARSQSETPVTWTRSVSASYFDVMGITVKAGRAFEPREAAPSVVINEAFVKKYFPNENPLGHRLRFGEESFTIIGVVADVKIAGALEPESRVETYAPYWQQPAGNTAIVLKTPGNPAQLAAPLRQAVLSIDRNVPVSNITSLADLVRDSIDQPRFVMSLAAAFALLALALAAVGIYGVMAYTVSQRTTEFGVRMALGAGRAEVFKLVLRDALTLTGAGVVAGIAGSLMLSRSLGTLNYGIRAADPLTLAGTSLALVIVAVVASLVPARRATRVDPIEALRAE